jgi:hypothetical protein
MTTEADISLRITALQFAKEHHNGSAAAAVVVTTAQAFEAFLRGGKA